MSTDEREEILVYLQAIKGFVKLVGSGVVAILIAVVSVLVMFLNDHFTLQSQRDDVTWMKPRVQRLWWASPLSASDTTDQR